MRSFIPIEYFSMEILLWKASAPFVRAVKLKQEPNSHTFSWGTINSTRFNQNALNLGSLLSYKVYYMFQPVQVMYAHNKIIRMIWWNFWIFLEASSWVYFCDKQFWKCIKCFLAVIISSVNHRRFPNLEEAMKSLYLLIFTITIYEKLSDFFRATTPLKILIVRKKERFYENFLLHKTGALEFSMFQIYY